mmetsp:Transcript_13472/g.40654  ORF Transcript_13472/g.40654 Transcript_13472/m.40654 type:complete len:212 (+) Transcript_13472:244-879(+)
MTPHPSPPTSLALSRKLGSSSSPVPCPPTLWVVPCAASTRPSAQASWSGTRGLHWASHLRWGVHQRLWTSSTLPPWSPTPRGSSDAGVWSQCASRRWLCGSRPPRPPPPPPLLGVRGTSMALARASTHHSPSSAVCACLKPRAPCVATLRSTRASTCASSRPSWRQSRVALPRPSHSPAKNTAMVTPPGGARRMPSQTSGSRASSACTLAM